MKSNHFHSLHSSSYHSQGIEVACVPTGVKFLHHRALDFDVGVYFEANGHGTVVFSSAAMGTVKRASEDQRYLDFSSLSMW